MCMCSVQKQRIKAFTLVELVITMALFAVVAALVLSYVVFMNGFTKRNSENGALTEQIIALRQNIDAWFSYFDREGCEITVSPEDNVIAAARMNGITYRLRLTLALVVCEDEAPMFVQTLECYYPADAGRGVCTETEFDGIVWSYCLVSAACPNVYSVAMEQFTDEWEYPGSDESETNTLRFGVKMRVTGGEYACTIRYRQEVQA